MNKLFTSCLVFILIFSTPCIMAQHKDCDSALELCGNTPLYIFPGPGDGISDSGVGNTCVSEEFNSMWVTWTVMESGTITFVLTPEALEQDIDFVVFKAEGENACMNKTPIRCMASGENINQPPHTWVNCTGLTGLSALETDIVEHAGCQPGSNNFLAPLQAIAGDQYMLLINNFFNSENGYTLSFGGTAVLGCITGISDQHDVNSKLLFTVNPAISTGTILIHLNDDRLSDSYLNVLSLAGQIVHSQKQTMESEFQVDLHHLPQGTYFAVLKTRNSIQTQKFLIAK